MLQDQEGHALAERNRLIPEFIGSLDLHHELVLYI